MMCRMLACWTFYKVESDLNQQNLSYNSLLPLNFCMILLVRLIGTPASHWWQIVSIPLHHGFYRQSIIAFPKPLHLLAQPVIVNPYSPYSWSYVFLCYSNHHCMLFHQVSSSGNSLPGINIPSVFWPLQLSFLLIGRCSMLSLDSNLLTRVSPSLLQKLFQSYICGQWLDIDR